jgi:hypothetical protein
MKRALAMAGILLLAISGTATAGQPDTVDPLLMQPPLNPTFAPWDCWRSGSGIVCDGERHLSWQGEETPFSCDGRPIYSSGTDDRTMRRWNDAEGRGLKTIVYADLHETLSLTRDGSGRTLEGIGRFSQRFDYGVPGDITTRTDTYRGIDVRITAPGLGLIVHDVGIKSFDLEGNVLFMHGPHPVVEDFFEAFAGVCPALLG